MDVLFGYKSMPEWHKKNIKNYYILDGIYKAEPNISEEDARYIFNICQQIKNEKVCPFSIDYYLTEHYMKDDIDDEELKVATSGEIISAVLHNDLNFLPFLNSDKVMERF